MACYIDGLEDDISESLVVGALKVLPSSEAIWKGHARAHVLHPDTLISEVDNICSMVVVPVADDIIYVCISCMTSLAYCHLAIALCVHV